MKKISAIILLIAMVMTMTVPSFAVEQQISASDTELSLYDQHPYMPNDMMVYSMNSQAAYDENTYIDGAIDFVKSLNLRNQGFDFIEEQCLEELEQYRNDDLKLLSYTVLTPKATTAEQELGTYNGRTFYYTLTSLATQQATKKDTVSSWGTKKTQFIKGVVDLIVTLADAFIADPITLSYTLFCDLLDVDPGYELQKKAYFEYIGIYALETRSIYAYRTSSSSSKSVCYKDQSGYADLSVWYYHLDPTNFPANQPSIYIDGKDDFWVQSPNYDNTNSILKTANSYFNRGEVCQTFVNKNPYSYWD